MDDLPGDMPRPVVPWGPRDVWLGAIAAAVILVLAWLLAIVVRSLSIEADPDLWIGLFPAVFELLFLIPVWWFTVHKYRVSPKAWGFVGFRWSVLAIGIGLLIAINIFTALYSALLAQFGLRPQSDLSPLFEEVSTPWPLFIATVVIAPFAEEIFFRGFAFAGLRGRYSWPVAAAISAALFALFHLELTFFIPAFLLGFLFAYLYHRSNSLWPGLILHIGINAVGIAAYYFGLTSG